MITRNDRSLSEQFGALILRLREARRLTIRSAAKLIGVSHARLAVIEQGIEPHSGRPTLPSVELATKMACAYNYPVEQLLLLAGHTPWVLTEEAAARIVQLAHLSPERWASCIEFLKEA